MRITRTSFDAVSELTHAAARMTFGSVASKSTMRVRKMRARKETPKRTTRPRIPSARSRFRISWLLLIFLFLLALVAIALPGHAQAGVPGISPEGDAS